MVVATQAIPARAQELHADLCLYGCPSGSPPTNDVVVRDIYILSSNDTTKFADWVAYRVTEDTIGPTDVRVWRPDPWLADNETLEPDDYRGAYALLGTDRGHQAPLASFTSTNNWEATNYLSNITPQKSALNRGAWLRLESAVRALTRRSTTGAVFVMTGPIYEGPIPSLPGADESHLIPSGYWKVIATQTSDMIKIASFRFDQDTERSADFCDDRFVTTARAVEHATGLNFFHALRSEEQNELENAATLLPELGCSS